MANGVRSRIVIAGGGFAGVTLAQRLERLTGKETELVLVSAENHLVFSPLLAETAGREISPAHVVVPGRQLVRRTRWLTAKAIEVERGGNTVHYSSPGGQRGMLRYDHLVLACGSVTDLNAVPGLAAYAYPLKTIGDAIFLGNNLIGRLEEAAVHLDPEERRRLLTVVVIGGGFSGIELAGALNDFMERARGFYAQLRDERPRVIVLHRGERILPELQAASLSEFALRKLRARGIEVRLHQEVMEISAREVLLKSGEHIETGAVMCTVGTAPNPLLETLGLPLERGRLRTGPDLLAEGCSNVWALGDAASVPNAWDGKMSPPTAQFATRQAKQLAANLARVLRNQPTRPFSYKPLGIMASVGHHNAVAEILGLRVSGLPAWFLWRSVYLAKMPTLLRKVEVAIDWAWSILFPPNIVQLQIDRTERVGRAHFAAGQFVFRKDEPGDVFYVIERGRAGVYLDEKAGPVAFLGAGDHFGEGAVLTPGGKGRHTASVRAETALDLITLGSDDCRRLTGSLKALQTAVQRSLAARRGYGRFMDIVRNEPRLRDRRVAELMSSPPETLAPDMTLEQAVSRFHGGRPGYPVANSDGSLTGYCGRAELYEAMRAVLTPETPLREFMRPDPPQIGEDQPLSEAAVVLLREQVEVLPIVAADGSGRVTGVLSPIDVFRHAIALREARKSRGAA